ncbi:MAG: alpha/beta hydrolase [Acidobacteria bacterium]|nr:alpha/beta hydrolase [Acidobacteriota bacterium]
MKKLTLLLTLSTLTTLTLLSAPAPATTPSFGVQVTGKGRPVILIPGLASGGATWDSTVAHLKGRFECHVLTLAGFAGQPPLSNRGDAPFLDTVRRDIITYIRTQKLAKPVIIGHSLGGAMALWLGETEPDLVGELVIVDSAPFLPELMMPGATVESMKPMANAMREQIASAKPGSQDEYLKTMAHSKDDVARIVEWSRKSDAATVGAAMVELYTNDLRPALNQIKSRVLALSAWSAYKDYTTRQRVFDNLTKQYSGVAKLTFELHDEAWHFMMFDEPAWFFAQLDKFLAQ